MKGTLYGVGVGPGDPELLTLKAVRVLKRCDLIAAPDSDTGGRLALQIAREYVQDKKVLLCPWPMTRDPERTGAARERAAELICARLDRGESVAFLTLGDPGIYSTYTYLHRLVRQAGYEAVIVPGVPSFCAAAAALDMPLCEGGQALHILPASHPAGAEQLGLEGVKVLMKSGKGLRGLLGELRSRGLARRTCLARQVGLPGQRLAHSAEDWDGEDAYLTLAVVKEE